MMLPQTAALLAGQNGDGGWPTYGDRVSNTEATSLATLALARLGPLEVDASPFDVGQPSGPKRELRWARPELVAAVEIAEWTASGKLRQSSFKGLREDKDPREVVREAVGPDAL